MSESTSDLILRAVEVLRRRADTPGGYAGLSGAAAHGLCRTLEGMAAGAPELDGVDGDEAVGLAHRLIDDDHPEQSPLWPSATDRPGPGGEHQR